MKITKSMIRAFNKELYTNHNMKKALRCFLNASGKIKELEILERKSRDIIYIPNDFPRTATEIEFVNQINNFKVKKVDMLIEEKISRLAFPKVKKYGKSPSQQVNDDLKSNISISDIKDVIREILDRIKKL